MSNSPHQSKSGQPHRKGNSKRRSRRGNQLESPKTLAKNGIDFFALVLGLTAAVMLLLLIFSLFRPSEKGPKLGAASGEKLATAVGELDREEFTQVVDSATTAELSEMLFSLNQAAAEPLDLKLDKQIRRHRRRAEISRKLLEHSQLDPDTKNLAIQTRLSALLAIYDLNLANRLTEPGIGQPGIGQLLTVAADKYANHSEERIAVAARLARLRMMVEDQDSIGDLARELYSLISDFPENSEVLDMADTVIRFQIVSPDRRANGEQLVNLLRSKPRIEGGDAIATFYAEIDDLKLLLDSGFYPTWEGREFSGQTSYQELQKVVMDLIEAPGAGSVVASYVTETAYWFERSNEYSFAIPIYQAMRERAESFAQSATGQDLLRQGAEGLIRCQLHQQPIVLEGNLINDQPLNPESFRNRICVIVFWKVSEQSSIDALKFIQSESASWQGKAVQMIAVCVDRRSDPSFDLPRIKTIAESYSDWTFCIRDPQDQLSLLDQCPSDRVPRVMLIDKQMHVVDVDVPLNELKTQVGLSLILQIE